MNKFLTEINLVSMKTKKKNIFHGKYHNNLGTISRYYFVPNYPLGNLFLTLILNQMKYKLFSVTGVQI